MRSNMGTSTTTTTTTTVLRSNLMATDAKQMLAAPTCNLPKKIVDMDTEDTDNNNFDTVSDHHNGKLLTATATTTATANGVAASAAAAKIEPVEYDYFGFKFGAKLKWANIIGIIVVHALFLYTFTHNPLLPRIHTYAWGECTF